jgi:coatomer subunit beta
VQKLVTALPSIKSGKVFRGILWILGEYVEGAGDIENALVEVRKVIGEIPIGASEQRALDEVSGDAEDSNGGGGEKKEKEKMSTRPKVLADGTYATETAYTTSTTAKLEAIQATTKPPLRSECVRVAVTPESATKAFALPIKRLSLLEISSPLLCWQLRWQNLLCASVNRR